MIKLQPKVEKRVVISISPFGVKRPVLVQRSSRFKDKRRAARVNDRVHGE